MMKGNKNDDDGNINDENNNIGNNKKQCFSSIQNRKLLGNLESCELCPSMDLVVYSTSAAPTSQSLFRTVSWQKVAVISPDDETHKSTAPRTTCWSPNGRWIAVGGGKEVQLFGVEPLANPPGGGAGFGSSSGEAQHSWAVDHPVVSLHWAHVGRPHPTAWNTSEDELEEEISWSYQSFYLDRAKDYLPPSAYHLTPEEDEDHHHHSETTTSTALPDCKTPLSVLVVTTTETLEFYLHGRYLILKFPLSTIMGSSPALPSLPPKAVASHDLAHFVLQSSSKISLVHLPFLKRDRYPLQVIASLHSSISSHLEALQHSTVEVLNSWRSSLKPLDAKMQPLLRLLNNYGIQNQTLGSILKQFILVGHTGDHASNSVANAIDQFFTSVQMNDQLIQRMERTLQGSLANVESQARKGIMSPTKALCLQIQELSGIIRYHGRKHHTTTTIQALVDASNSLWISSEALIKMIMTSRFRVRDFVSWLRSAGSQIKARGTATNSVQRENAKKRRVPQAVLERLVTTLNTDSHQPDQSPQYGLSEHLLSMNVSAMLKEDPAFIPPKDVDEQGKRAPSPSTVSEFFKHVPTVAYATNQTLQAAAAVFDNPLSNIPDSIQPRVLELPQMDGSIASPLAVVTRVGRDSVLEDPWAEDSEDEEQEARSYFSPRVVEYDHTHFPDISFDCRQWSIIGRAFGNIIQLYCVPLGWRGDPNDIDLDDDDDDNVASPETPFCLTCKLNLPESGVVRELSFYSDDGKSSLSSGNDSGSGREGRQKLGILFQKGQGLELWMVSYDQVPWQAVPVSSTLTHPAEVAISCCLDVKTLPETSEEDDDMDDDSDGTLIANSRLVSEGPESVEAISRLFLCGSRGVGGVALTAQGITTLELFDLEEDEDAVDDDEEFDEEEEA